MIFAEYQNDETNSTFRINFSNVELGTANFKQVNATYHLENAINKAFDAKERPQKFHLKVADPHNYYLKLIAISFAAFVRGLGFSATDVETENF